MPFQSIDLCQARPSRIGIEHFTGGDRARFDPSVTLVGFLCAEKIGLDFAKAGLGIFRSKQGLDVFVQLRLVFFHRQHIIALGFQDLDGQPSLCMPCVAGNHFL